MWITPGRRRLQRWIVPALAAVVGVAVGGTLALRGEAKTGLVTLAVLVGYGLVLASRRGETAFALHEAFGVGRRTGAHIRAAAVTGDVLVGVIVAGVLIQALRGADIDMLAVLAAVAGMTYFAASVFFNNSY